jgi:hypothetical protein
MVAALHKLTQYVRRRKGRASQWSTQRLCDRRLSPLARYPPLSVQLWHIMELIIDRGYLIFLYIPLDKCPIT